MNNPIYHLANAEDVKILAESGSYHTASLDTEGFIHCCTAVQMAGVIQRYYSDAEELIVLTLDESKLNADLVLENTTGGEELFPHIYGKINQEAVQAIETINKDRIIDIAKNGKF